jgi:LuxR family maltose regulon positive regulatory protein
VPSRSPEFLDAVADALGRAGPLVWCSTACRSWIHPTRSRACDPAENRPPGLRRRREPSDPPRLGRLRLAGELRELRACARLHPEEAAAVLARADVRVTAAQHRLLHAQTGWPAALRLASISLRETADPAAFLSDLTGNGQAISDYLVGEILSSLPDEVVEVLFAVSVCDAVTAPLAAALVERGDAADVLADLEHRTSLVVSYGEGKRWFRLHPLLRAHLYADLRRRSPDRTADLHRRALAWFADTPIPRALEDATPPTTSTWSATRRKHGAVLATSGHHAEVGAALERLDAAGLLRDDARLLLVGALGLMERGFDDAADVLLAQRTRLPTEPDEATAALAHASSPPGGPIRRSATGPRAAERRRDRPRR